MSFRHRVGIGATSQELRRESMNRLTSPDRKESLRENIEGMTEDQRSTITVHINLCLQAVVLENLAVPLHESSIDARSNMEGVLRDVYVKHIAAILKLAPRPPIVMINHDRRFLALCFLLWAIGSNHGRSCPNEVLRSRAGSFMLEVNDRWGV